MSMTNDLPIIIGVDHGYGNIKRMPFAVRSMRYDSK